MTALAYLVSTCATARQNTLDSSLTAIRAYQLALRAEAELAETTACRRAWLKATVGRLDVVWRDLDSIRWDHGPPPEPPPNETP